MSECLSVCLFLGPVSCVGTGMQLNSFISERVGEQNWGREPPKALKPHGRTRSRFCRGAGAPAAPAPPATSAAKSLTSQTGWGEKRGWAMSFKSQIMLLFGFSRNKSKARTHCFVSLWKIKTKTLWIVLSFSHKRTLRILFRWEKNSTFLFHLEICLIFQKINQYFYFFFNSKNSTAGLWKHQGPKWQNVLRKKENTTTMIFSIKIPVFSYQEIAVDCLVHYSNL